MNYPTVGFDSCTVHFLAGPWLKSIASEIVAQRQAEESKEPDHSSGSCEMQETTTSLNVHKEKHHE
jgi:hypothetical protein